MIAILGRFLTGVIPPSQAGGATSDFTKVPGAQARSGGRHDEDLPIMQRHPSFLPPSIRTTSFNHSKSAKAAKPTPGGFRASPLGRGSIGTGGPGGGKEASGNWADCTGYWRLGDIPQPALRARFAILKALNTVCYFPYLCWYVYVYMCVCVWYVYLYMCVCIWVCVCLYICSYVGVHMCIYVSMYRDFEGCQSG